ncbi:Voltage-dependent calcium channel type A subunit alpha-1 [Gryllus bimaculatus]|nr:Voltage-dependent calcium channel type A subunit alpha-1 [Gryllus bimaculatus]
MKKNSKSIEEKNERLAAAQEAVAQQRCGRDCSPAPGHGMGPHPQQGPPGNKGPTSLFFLSEDNPIRRYTRFIIEWPYPFSCAVSFTKLYVCACASAVSISYKRPQFLRVTKRALWLGLII